MNTYDIGDRVRVTAAFRNIAGTLTDPTTTVVKVHKPDGSESTPTPTNDSTGVFHADLDIDQAGFWTYRFIGTGSVVSADERSFYVSASVFATP